MMPEPAPSESFKNLVSRPLSLDFIGYELNAKKDKSTASLDNFKQYFINSL